MDHHHPERAAADDEAGHSDQRTRDPDAETEAAGSRRQSGLSFVSQGSSCRASRRTEALIHAAARDIVEHVGGRHHGGPEAVDALKPDDGGDSSSHHEHDDDVFSDHSPRSSLGSMSEAEQTKIEQTLSQRNITQRVRSSPPMSDMAPSDHEQCFVATVRCGAPRPPFRSPSSVQALQMTSPPASTLGTPRSNRRTPLPTVSRLASPTIMAQYSPKKTPPRFKRATPPLVLLHVTLLPLRWAWARVLDRAEPAHLSPEAKTLREAWRQLQDRTGDTVSDRGILLPHPQADYEVLEERLLEALELPLRRRARILECGHYLGPANELSPSSDVDSEDDECVATDRAHWCRTCHSEIRYDSLGRAKVFRVKVYASNGLMRAGAWEACWKEMERVDVELEPLLDAALHEELVHLLADQDRALDMEQALADEHHEASETEYEEDLDELLSDRESEGHRGHEPCSSPPRPAEAPPNSSPTPMMDGAEDDEERLRDMYRRSPQPRREKARDYTADSVPRGSSPSPPPARASWRGQDGPQAYKTASFPELVLEAAKVLLQDRKNVMIALLSALILMLAVRGGRPAHDSAAFPPLMAGHDARAVPRHPRDPVSEAPLGHGTATAAPSQGPPSQSAAADPCASSLEVVADDWARRGADDASKSTLRVFETWRVVETVTETARETLTHTETVSVGAPPAALETDALARWGA